MSIEEGEALTKLMLSIDDAQEALQALVAFKKAEPKQQ